MQQEGVEIIEAVANKEKMRVASSARALRCDMTPAALVAHVRGTGGQQVGGWARSASPLPCFAPQSGHAKTGEVQKTATRPMLDVMSWSCLAQRPAINIGLPQVGACGSLDRIATD